jgi:hypothetical protein
VNRGNLGSKQKESIWIGCQLEGRLLIKIIDILSLFRKILSRIFEMVRKGEIKSLVQKALSLNAGNHKLCHLLFVSQYYCNIDTAGVDNS